MSNIDKQALRDIAEKTKIAGEAPVMPFEQRINALNDFMKHFTPATMLALLDELEALQSFRTAFNEWHDKTEWVQGDNRFDVIKPWGKHRADVLKLYIEHLEEKLKTADKLQDSAFRHGLQYGFSYGQTNDQAGFEQCLAAYSSRGKDNG